MMDRPHGPLPIVATEEALSRGGSGIVPGLRRGTDFRSNLGFLNLSGEVAQVRAELVDAGGRGVGHGLVLDLPAHGWYQVNDVFAAAEVPLATTAAYARVAVLSEGASVWAYGSMVDNATNDPTSLPMVKVMP